MGVLFTYIFCLFKITSQFHHVKQWVNIYTLLISPTTKKIPLHMIKNTRENTDTCSQCTMFLRFQRDNCIHINKNNHSLFLSTFIYYMFSTTNCFKKVCNHKKFYLEMKKTISALVWKATFTRYPVQKYQLELYELFSSRGDEGESST